MSAAIQNALIIAEKHIAQVRLVGGLLRTGTRPTSNLLLLLRRLHVSIWAFTLKVTHAPMSVECLFSMTLLPGVYGCGRRRHRLPRPALRPRQGAAG